MIKPCTCNHEYQDAKHGRGNRVWNPMKGGGCRCTVCGTTKAGTSKIEVKVKETPVEDKKKK